ncbi:NAD(P)-dependent oxidoreductase [candidate division KSB1 bacterium]|nr:NAD(P)-dependent oxidoreductase [candidate division KSB1 bacterium]
MHILVTGNQGFIGSFLAQALLEAGHTIRGLDINNDGKHLNNFPTIKANILDKKAVSKAVKGVECIIHLASEHKDFGISSEEYFSVNEKGTRVLLECASEARVNKFIFFSSVAVYGDQQATTEETPPNPTNPYGASKLAAEKVIKYWVYENPQRQVVIIRPTVVFGPRNFANIFRLIKQVCDRRFIWIGKGDNIKSVAYVENLVAATLFLLDRMKPGLEVFNYSDEPHMKTRQLVNLIAEKAGVPVTKCIVPFGFALFFSKIFDAVGSITGHDFPITSARIEKFDTPTYHRAEKIKLWRFTPIYSIEKGIEITVSWYNDEYKPLKRKLFYSESLD